MRELIKAHIHTQKHKLLDYLLHCVCKRKRTGKVLWVSYALTLKGRDKAHQTPSAAGDKGMEAELWSDRCLALTSGTLKLDRALRTHTAFLSYIEWSADMEIIRTKASGIWVWKTKIKEVKLVNVKQKKSSCCFSLQ